MVVWMYCLIIWTSHVEAIESFPTDKFRQMIDIMLTGSFIGTKYALPIMKAQHSGRILNMASINGVIGFSGKALIIVRNMALLV